MLFLIKILMLLICNYVLNLICNYATDYEWAKWSDHKRSLTQALQVLDLVGYRT